MKLLSFQALCGNPVRHPFTQHRCSYHMPTVPRWWPSWTDGRQQPRRDVFDRATVPRAANKKLSNLRPGDGTMGQKQGESVLIHSAAGWEPAGQHRWQYTYTTRGSPRMRRRWRTCRQMIKIKRTMMVWPQTSVIELVVEPVWHLSTSVSHFSWNWVQVHFTSDV